MHKRFIVPHSINGDAISMDSKHQMLTEVVRRKVWKAADQYYSEDDWAHGRRHIERVVRMSMKIGKSEGADLDVVELAGILHDIFARKEQGSNDRAFRHDIQGAIEARRILGRIGLDTETIEAVSHCIETHRKRAGKPPQTIEAKCLFDGDKLDALGAIGVLRTAFVAFSHRQEFYREENDIEAYKRTNIGPDGRVIDFAKHSPNLEYELSLRLIPMQMYTEAGKKLAKERAAFMDEFFERIGKEMHGLR